jgi:peptidoglycan/LPS O-acetylase OafA/YrhL
LRRAFRIFPLYWVALTVVVVLDGLGGTRWWQVPFHYLLLNNLVPGRQQALFPVAWTLTLEVLFYIAVPLMASLIAGARRPIRAERLAALVLASWALSIVFCVFADLQGDGEIGLWLRGSFPAMWQMFCPGILLAIAPHLTGGGWQAWVKEFPWRPVALPLAVGALLLAAILFADAPLRFGIDVYQLLVDFSRPLFAVGYGVLIAAAIRARPWGGYSSWGFRLGLISYGIYLIHAVLADFLSREHLAPIPHDTLAAFVVNAAVLCSLTIALALVSWRWLEQPAIALGRRLGASWRGRRGAAIAPAAERSG